MRQVIPQPIIGVLAEVLPDWSSHDVLNNLFLYAGAPGEPPPGSKPAKVQAWLFLTNKDRNTEPLRVLGRILEKYLDEELDPNWDNGPGNEQKKARNQRLRDVLANSGLSYSRGGVIAALDSPQVRSLEEEIRKMEEPAIDYEFKRAVENVDSDPFEAVSAACNILESIFKVIIEKRDLPPPNVQDLAGLWKVIRSWDLTPRPSAIRTFSRSSLGYQQSCQARPPCARTRVPRMGVAASGTLLKRDTRSWRSTRPIALRSS